jgi:hypothetical protein
MSPSECAINQEKNRKSGGKLLAREYAQPAGDWSTLACQKWFLDANQTRANRGDAVIQHANAPLLRA